MDSISCEETNMIESQPTPQPSIAISFVSYLLQYVSATFQWICSVINLGGKFARSILVYVDLEKILLKWGREKKTATVYVVDGFETCEKVWRENRARYPQAYNFLGMDCEWVSQPGCSNNPIALLQLATPNNECFLIRLAKMNSQRLPQTLKATLEDGRVLKFGVGIMDDAKKLANQYGVNICGCVDLRHLVLRCKWATEKEASSDERGCQRIQKMGLHSLAERIIGVKMDKHWKIRCSNWEAEKLSVRQVEYAANDALVAIHIFLQLVNLKDKEITARGELNYSSYKNDVSRFSSEGSSEETNKPLCENSSADEKDDTCVDLKDDTCVDEKDDTSVDEEDDTSVDEKDDTSVDDEDDTCVDEKDDTSVDDEDDTCVDGKDDTCVDEKDDTCVDGKDDTCVDEKEDTCISADLVDSSENEKLTKEMPLLASSKFVEVFPSAELKNDKNEYQEFDATSLQSKENDIFAVPASQFVYRSRDIPGKKPSDTENSDLHTRDFQIDRTYSVDPTVMTMDLNKLEIESKQNLGYVTKPNDLISDSLFCKRAISLCQGLVDQGFKQKCNNKKPKPVKEVGKDVAMQPKKAGYIVQVKKKLPYSRCVLQAPDGSRLCTLGRKKADWYLVNKLGELIAEDPYTVRLKFEPAGRPKSKEDYYLTFKENICVVCGKSDTFLSKSIVPRDYRQHFPSCLKDHHSHDILVMCPQCHRRASDYDLMFRRKLADEYGAPIGNKGNGAVARLVIDQNLKKVQFAAKAIVYSGGKLPQKRKEELLRIVEEYYGETDVSEDMLHSAATMSIKKLNCDFKSHGEEVVKKVLAQGKLLDFEKAWRQHFLDEMSPKYLPPFWSVDHRHEEIREKLV